MTDIAPSSVPIQEESVQFGSPVSESAGFSIGGAVNYLLAIQNPVGSILYSFLTPTQLNQALNFPSPPTYVLADGSDITGSILQQVSGLTNVPDMRGGFARGKNNGRNDGFQNPDGDLPLGTFTPDRFRNHTHLLTVSALGSLPFALMLSPSNNGQLSSSSIQEAPDSTQPDGFADTAPSNVTCNIYVRIN